MIAFRNRVSATLAGVALILAPAPAAAGAVTGTSPSIAAPGAATVLTDPICEVTYLTTTRGDITIAVATIKNKGVAAINGWSLTFQLPAGQKIIGAQGATYQPPSGAVTANDVGANAYVPPGQVVKITFSIQHNGSAGNPSAFAVNGNPCAVVIPPPK